MLIQQQEKLFHFFLSEQKWVAGMKFGIIMWIIRYECS